MVPLVTNLHTLISHTSDAVAEGGGDFRAGNELRPLVCWLMEAPSVSWLMIISQKSNSITDAAVPLLIQAEVLVTFSFGPQ